MKSTLHLKIMQSTVAAKSRCIRPSGFGNDDLVSDFGISKFN